MKTRRILVILFVTALLVVLLGCVIHTRQQKEARSERYATILADAPCLANVCPGFNKGRDQALELLARSDSVVSKAQGETLIHLLFPDGEGGFEGDGGIYFNVDSRGNPQVIRRISFSFDHLSLRTVFNGLGEPDEFLFVSGCGMGFRVHAKLLYLKRGVEVAVEYETRRPATQVLTPNTPVASIEYFLPANLQEHIRESLDWYVMDSVAYDFHPSITADDILAQIRSWPGLEAAITPSADFCPR